MKVPSIDNNRNPELTLNVTLLVAHGHLGGKEVVVRLHRADGIPVDLGAPVVKNVVVVERERAGEVGDGAPSDGITVLNCCIDHYDFFGL